MTLSGRTAIITGASQGLGFAIAEHFLDAGASILICARSEGITAVRTALAAKAKPGQTIEAMTCDVSHEADVDTLAAKAVALFGKVDILVNNAGIYGPMGAIEDVDWDEWKRALKINLYGVVYPCRALARHMRANGYGKIINLSGGGATNPMPNVTAYAASKAAVVRFTESLALELKDAHIDVNAVAPGALATRMMDEAIDAGPEKVGADFHARMIKIKAAGGTPLAKGAALCVYLASAASDGITGRLISAQWDPWPFADAAKVDMDATDIYGLRKITPRDRGKTWGGE